MSTLDTPFVLQDLEKLEKLRCQHIFKFLKTEIRMKERNKENILSKNYDVFIEQKVDVFFCEKCLKYEEVLLAESYYPGFQNKN